MASPAAGAAYPRRDSPKFKMLMAIPDDIAAIMLNTDDEMPSHRYPLFSSTSSSASARRAGCSCIRGSLHVINWTLVLLFNFNYTCDFLHAQMRCILQRGGYLEAALLSGGKDIFVTNRVNIVQLSIPPAIYGTTD